MECYERISIVSCLIFSSSEIPISLQVSRLLGINIFSPRKVRKFLSRECLTEIFVRLCASIIIIITFYNFFTMYIWGNCMYRIRVLMYTFTYKEISYIELCLEIFFFPERVFFFCLIVQCLPRNSIMYQKLYKLFQKSL